MTTAADALARRKHLTFQSDRRSTLKRLDCYDPEADWPFKVALPHPAVLGSAWILPYLRERGREVYMRTGGGPILTRPAGSDDEPQPIDPQALAPVLRRALAALPERRDGGTSEAYRNVRRAALHGAPEVVDEYLVSALKAVRSSAPRWVPPEERPVPQKRPPALSPRARQRVHRAGRKDREIAAAALVLAEYLRERLQDDSPEEFVLASAIWREADLVARGLAHAGALPVTRLGRNGFLQVADSILGGRRRRAGGAGFVIPAGNALVNATSDAEDLEYDARDRAITATEAAREAERSAGKSPWASPDDAG